MLFRGQRPICHIRQIGLLFLRHMAGEMSILLSSVISKIVRIHKATGLDQSRLPTASDQTRKICLLTSMLLRDRHWVSVRIWTPFLMSSFDKIPCETSPERLVVLAGCFSDNSHFWPAIVAVGTMVCGWYSPYSLCKASS